MRRISIYLLLFLLTAMLCACQSTAVSADGSSVLFGIPVCNADTAETLKAARTPSEILPTLYTQEDGEGIRHAIPLAQNEKTPTYYLPLDTDNPDWDSITLISDAALYIVSDSALPDKATALRTGHNYRILICGEQFYSEARLICTGLPMLKIDLYSKADGGITASTKIERSPDSPMFFSYYDPCDPITNTVVSDDCAGRIHTRGGTSAKYDKHSFKFSLYSDITCNAQKNMALCGLRDDDDWVLNAMYQEETKVRDMLAYDLWEDIGADHYGDGSHIGTRMRYVEVILGGKYWGLYGLCEPEDAKQFGISAEEPGCVYKVGSWTVPSVEELRHAIRNELPYVAEVEVKYPEVTDESARDAWKPFLDYVEATYESTYFTFSQTIDQYVDEDNLIDLWIHLNVISGRDNQWKNLYLACRASDGKLVMAPWDCDISFGLGWQEGDHESLHLFHEKAALYSLCELEVHDRYLKRNLNGFADRLAERWWELRGDWLCEEEIISRANTFRRQTEDSGAMARNRRKWPKSGYADTLDYLEEFVHIRIPLIDDYIRDLTEE